MVKIKEAIVVEGRYDKNTLSQIVDTTILETKGFGIRKDDGTMGLIRKVAEKQGVIVFTDSDGGGLLIRNFLKGAIPGKYLKHAYIPDIQGKEKRKKIPGKEGKLGVEGMRPEVILDCLKRAGATFLGEENAAPKDEITKADFVEWGLSGGQDSSEKRRALQKRLDFPEKMSANALLEALNTLYSRQECLDILRDLE